MEQEERAAETPAGATPAEQLKKWDGRESDVSMTRIFGFGFERLWVMLLVYTISPYLVESVARETLYTHQLASTAFLAASLLFLALSSDRGTALYRNRPLLAASTLAMAVGTLVYLLGTMLAPESPNAIALVVAGALTGFGSANLFVAWIQEIIDSSTGNVIVECASGSCIAILLSTVIAFFLPYAIMPVAVAAPFVSLFLLERRAHAPAKASAGAPDAADVPNVPLSRASRALFARGLVAILLLGLIEGFFDAFTGYRAFAVESQHGIYLFAAGLVLLLVAALIGIFKREDAMSLIYRISILVLIVGCVGILQVRDFSTASGALVFAGYQVMAIALAVVCAVISQSFRIGLVRTIAAAYACLYVGELLGELGGMALGPETAQTLLPAIAAVSIVVLALVTLFLFGETDFVRLGIGEVDSVLPESSRAEGEPDGSEDDGGAVAGVPGARETREETGERICRTIVERYGLSPRESEVLELLLEGRTIKRIQEALFISQGTVSTHIRHIYQKTGSANRQELLDLAERVAGEGSADADGAQAGGPR